MNTKTIYKIYCSKCKKHIGDYKNIPAYDFIKHKVRNEKQPYIYTIFKQREEGMTYFDIEAFCCKKCKHVFIKEFDKI